MRGRIHSIQSLGTVDGPGLRAVVFTRGCPLRCDYCHNPDTWSAEGGEAYEAEELVERLRRFYPYIRGGGVTFSGGEPCLMADFLIEVTDLLHKDGIHVALDTSGAIVNEGALALIERCDLVMLDIKFTTDFDYKAHTGGHISGPLTVLKEAERLGKSVWIRHVVVPDLTASREDGLALAEIIKGYTVIKRVELLPFRRLCLEKYEALGIPFPHRDTREASESDLLCVKEGLTLGGIDEAIIAF